MHLTKLRKVGGSVMLAVPPALLESLHLAAGRDVGLEISDGRLVVAPSPRPRYTLDELLAQHEGQEPMPRDEEWLDSAPLGRELL